MEQMGLELEPARRLYTVAELNAEIRAALDEPADAEDLSPAHVEAHTAHVPDA